MQEYGIYIKSFNLCYNVFMLTEDQKQKIGKFVADKPVELVYLFGSRATGEVGPMSDYDFAVLFSEKLDSQERFNLKLQVMGFLTTLLKTDKVDVVDLLSAPVALCYNAVLPRGEIFVRSHDRLVDFETKITLKYFDRQKYIKAHTSASLSAFAERGFAK